MEVIYTGLRQTPEAVAKAAIEEDVDVVGISVLSGAHMFLIPEVLKLLKEQGAESVLVIAGGVIPGPDAKRLEAMGVDRVFEQGVSSEEMAEFVRTHVPTHIR